MGQQVALDSDEAIGQNERGQWLANWCVLQSFEVANATPGAQMDDLWTFRRYDLYKQLDYILVDSLSQIDIVECGVWQHFSTGSDHRPVSASLVFRSKIRTRNRRKKAVSWNAFVDVNAYQSRLCQTLSAHPDGPADPSCKARSLENQMTSACASAIQKPDRGSQGTAEKDLSERIRALIAERRSCSRDELPRKAALCKRIRKLIRERSNFKKESKINVILNNFRGIREISNISKPQKRMGISSILSQNGHEATSKDSIAEVFATFYETLYFSTQTSQHTGCAETPTPFTKDDLQKAIGKLKKGKAQNAAGVVAKMIKKGGSDLRTEILDLFNDILDPQAVPPDSWKKTRLTVIFKKGDSKAVKNYRPIASIPILYKLFSLMVCARIQNTVYAGLSPDQAAYRPGFSTEDHLLAAGLLIDGCAEWNQELWLGLVDFEKAFDTVEHHSLFKVLNEIGVEPCYVDLLKRLYAQQEATVQVGTESRPFALLRGVKQGDPISGLLFIAVMEVCFRRLRSKWATANSRRKGQYFGVVVDDPREPLTNLRFADNVLLVAQSASDVKKMLSNLRDEAAKYGLIMHLGKTKVLTTVELQTPLHVMVGVDAVEVLDRNRSETYLGQKLCLGSPHDAAFAHRLCAGWAAFSKYKDIFTSKSYAFSLRAKLLESVVTPAVLYGAGTWTLTKAMEAKLVTTKRQMLRKMLGAKRENDETWVDYVQRSTHLAEDKMNKMGYENWVGQCRRKKWKLAGRISQTTDGRWSKRLICWRPFFRCHPCRDVGRPCARWGDSIAKLAGEDWAVVAVDQDYWRILEEGFVQADSL